MFETCGLKEQMKLIREFHLSPPGKGGVSCDADGAFIGTIPILTRLHLNGKDEWHLRDSERLSKQMSAVYGLPVDMSSKTGGLKSVANALNEGDVARAQIATVLLGIPDPPQLFKVARWRDRMITLIRDLHWSGMLKWDPDKHPRWPAGSADSKGGEFAPKGKGGETAASLTSQSDAKARIQLADAGMSDAEGDPVAEAAARAADATRRDRNANTVLVAADGEDEEDPRFGIGGNYPPEELIPQRLQRSPAGPPVQFLDNLLGITAPGEATNLEVTELQQRALLQRIHEIDPNYVYESIAPPGGLAGMSWQERANVISGLQADLAAAIYRVTEISGRFRR